MTGVKRKIDSFWKVHKGKFRIPIPESQRILYDFPKEVWVRIYSLFLQINFTFFPVFPDHFIYHLIYLIE